MVLQNYLHVRTDSSGSYSGITYSADGKYLLFSQDSSNVAIANVSAPGPADRRRPGHRAAGQLLHHVLPEQPDRRLRPFRAARSIRPSTSYPGGVAFSEDGKSAYALLNQNNTLTKIDLTATPPTQGAQIRVGNAPHSIVINSAGKTAYISNEGGRVATEADFQIYSAGTRSSPTR